MTNRFTASEADKQLSEEDIKLRYITPAIIDKCWSVEDITMETKVKLTDGKINLMGNLVARGKAKYADSKIDQTLSEIQKILGVTID